MNYSHNTSFTISNFAIARPDKYLLSTYDVPGIVLSTGDVVVNKTDLVPVPVELTQWVQLPHSRTPNI